MYLSFSYLYTILADNAVSSTPLIVACNKQDLTMAKGATVVKGLLEKEMYVDGMKLTLY